jgi:hypothetical protein
MSMSLAASVAWLIVSAPHAADRGEQVVRLQPRTNGTFIYYGNLIPPPHTVTYVVSTSPDTTFSGLAINGLSLSYVPPAPSRSLPSDFAAAMERRRIVEEAVQERLRQVRRDRPGAAIPIEIMADAYRAHSDAVASVTVHSADAMTIHWRDPWPPTGIELRQPTPPQDPAQARSAFRARCAMVDRALERGGTVVYGPGLAVLHAAMSRGFHSVLDSLRAGMTPRGLQAIPVSAHRYLVRPLPLDSIPVERHH